MDVFFYEAFEEEEEALKHYLPAHISAGFTWKTIQEYGADSPPAPIISIRTQSSLPPEWADSLDAILSRSTGFDHLKAYMRLTGKDIPCGHLPLYCHRAVAEQALLMWLALQRKFTQQVEQFKTFHRDGITGQETEGKTLLIVGVGNIGGQVANIGKGMNMKVLCVDLEVKYPELDYVSIEEGIAQADIIVCAMDLRQENEGYFTYDLLKKAKKGTLFINVSRGELSPSPALLKLIEEKHLGGVALDAYFEEKALGVALRDGTNSDNPGVQATLDLAKHSNVICTPHNAFNTEEGVERKSEQSVQQIDHFLKNKDFIWPVRR